MCPNIAEDRHKRVRGDSHMDRRGTYDPTDEVITAYAAVADVFDEVFRSKEDAEKHAAWLIGELGRLGARRVLDAGAGTGEQAIRLRQSGRFEVVVANDISAEMLVYCSPGGVDKGFRRI
jgi:ubiquinone/menaquinone biosynthesis C-methylase UbiE